MRSRARENSSGNGADQENRHRWRGRTGYRNECPRDRAEAAKDHTGRLRGPCPGRARQREPRDSPTVWTPAPLGSRTGCQEAGRATGQREVHHRLRRRRRRGRPGVGRMRAFKTTGAPFVPGSVPGPARPVHESGRSRNRPSRTREPGVGSPAGPDPGGVGESRSARRTWAANAVIDRNTGGPRSKSAATGLVGASGGGARIERQVFSIPARMVPGRTWTVMHPEINPPKFPATRRRAAQAYRLPRDPMDAREIARKGEAPGTPPYPSRESPGAD